MRGFLLSILAHAALLAAVVLYVPHAAQWVEEVPMVQLELVRLGDETNVRARTAEPEPEPEPEPEEELTTEDEIVQEAPPPAPPEEEEAPPPPAPAPVEEEEEAAPPPEDPDPAPPPPPPPPSFDSLLNQAADTANQNRGERSDFNQEQIGEGDDDTAELSVYISAMVSRCWRTSLDVPYPEQRAVVLNIELERNGELRGSPSVDDRASRDRRDRYQTIVRERAVTAMIQCAPFDLPPGRYDEWRQITVNFNPATTPR